MGAPPAWVAWHGVSPVVAVALHSGHDVRPEVAARMMLDEPVRWLEEDPFTGHWATVADNGFVVSRSRFEVDLNRPRARAIYQRPTDAWGLRVWREPLPRDVVERSLELYDLFYAVVGARIDNLLTEHPRLVVLDLHTYNHRREGAEAAPAPADDFPEWNIGTANLDRERFAALVDRFVLDLAASRESVPFDVRENVCFRGGHFTAWLHARYGDRVCGLAVECKKFFMDEWSATVSAEALEEPRRALASTIPGLLEELSWS